MIQPLTMTAIPDIPAIGPGDDLARIIGDCLAHATGLHDGDVLCVAHKVFSKAEGNVIALEGVAPSDEAKRLARDLNKDAKKLEVILGQTAKVLRSFRRPEQKEGTVICEHKLGFISANAGVDESNAEQANTVITLPDDPDASAERLGKALEARFGCHIGVVMSDTFGRPWRLGQVNVAIGLYRVPAKVSDVGKVDAWGRTLAVTEPALCDEIAAASGLVVRKAAKTPVVLFRGLDWPPAENSSARQILRDVQEDMFR